MKLEHEKIEKEKKRIKVFCNHKYLIKYKNKELFVTCKNCGKRKEALITDIIKNILNKLS